MLKLIVRLKLCYGIVLWIGNNFNLTCSSIALSDLILYISNFHLTYIFREIHIFQNISM